MGNNSEQSKTSLLFFLALANLLSAFGSGTVLIQGLVASKEEKPVTVLEDDATFIAFLIGTVVGLVLVTFLRSSKLERLRSSRLTGGIIALSSAAMSFLLIALITWMPPLGGGDNFLPTAIFLVLLTLRFGLGFVPRSLRADAAAGYGQRIGWVELTYALGMVLGLLFSGQSYVGNLVKVLYMDAFFQIAAGILDIFSRRMSFNQRAASKEGAPHEDPLPIDWSLFTKVSMAAIAITIGIQIVMIECRSKFGPELAPNILATFYFGATVASLIYSQIDMKLILRWGKEERISVVINRGDKQRAISFALFTFIPAGFLLLAIIGNSYRGGWEVGSFLNTAVNIMFMLMLAAAAFFLEFIILLIFNFIGQEGLKRHRQGLVPITFGLMGLGGAVFITVIHLLGSDHTVMSSFSWTIIIIVCVIVTNLAIRSASKKRSSPLTPRFGD